MPRFAAASCTPAQAKPAGVASAGTPVDATSVNEWTSWGVGEGVGVVTAVEVGVTGGLAVPVVDAAGDEPPPPESRLQPETRRANPVESVAARSLSGMRRQGCGSSRKSGV
jgi:hypothetical protein